MTVMCNSIKNLWKINPVRLKNFSTGQLYFKKKEKSTPTRADLIPDNQQQFFTIQPSTGDLVVSERYKSITIITLNRPEHKNALNKVMIDKIIEAIKTFENDASSTIAILNGIGGNFCTGYDLEDLEENVKSNRNYFQEISHAFRIPTKPIVASINGSCFSAGFELALACDYRVIEDNTVLGYSQGDAAIPLIGEGTARLAQITGLSKATDIVLTRRKITAKEAIEMGLASIAVNIGTGMGKAFSIATTITHFPSSTNNYHRNFLCGQSKPVISADVIDDFLKKMAHLKTEKTPTYSGVKKLTHHFDLNALSEWERDEYIREIQYLNKKSE